MLVHHFLNRFAPGASFQVTPAAMKSLLQYEWPGNVRELENSVERAAILAETDVIHAHDLPEKLNDKSAAPPASNDGAGMTLEELEREHIRRVLLRVQGDKVRAAEALGIHLSTLYRKVQRYRLENVGAGEDTARIAAAARSAPTGR